MPKAKLIYIVGMSHSGSTLLDLLLNAHSRLVSVGELRKFSARIGAGERFPCTCGEMALDGCSFWPGVAARLATQGIPLSAISTDCGKASAAAVNEALVHAISAECDGAVVVDSSKITRRLEQLLHAENLDILPVLLIRDPRGQICSTISKGGAGLGPAIREYNRSHRKMLQLLVPRPYHVLRYEELAADPATALGPLLERMQFAFEPAQHSWAAAEKHSLAGNRMRHLKDSAIHVDRRWETQLRLWQKAAILLGTWHTRRRLAALG